MDLDVTAIDLSAEQRLAVGEAGRFFATTGEWPELRSLIRELARRGLSAGVREAASSLPSSLGFESQQKLVLTAEGLALSGHGADILDALVEFSRLAASIYLGDDDPPIITSAAVALVVGEERCRRLRRLIETEHFLIGSGNTDGDAWRWEVSEGAAQFRDCTSMDEYLAVRRELLRRPQKPTFSSAVLAPADTSTAVVDLEALHPAIRDAVADRVIEGRLLDAVLPACLAVRDLLRSQTAMSSDGTDLVERASSQLVFGGDLSSRTGRNLNEGTKLLLLGLMRGVRNVMVHDPDRLLEEELGELIALCSLLARRIERAEQPGEQVGIEEAKGMTGPT